ncbi:transglutaminase-like cysteine peptidase [Notoacmeibacter sp. MSK16QG-6]|uniref:transglutaminase-like cysteine peptidase n=1 Tax=Notoacmeibacter sp. MSK16QG-6 TaxID=2957982 RepID=UPI00209EAB80|nr:transglutaminase-like cysteine peptidase [Notoacmeibacter sp. MSK16QG-6]MCP1197861.1 transglutaminase-like cysteine peptidase [Notoacmeibacter sp. MSK16QG-6]
MQRIIKTITYSIASLLFVCGVVEARPFMNTTGAANPPLGHAEFCWQAPSECSDRASSPKPYPLSQASWEAILAVNATVNAEVMPLTDLQIWGREELWSYPQGVGDCEDYVLEKRRRLQEAGVPASALLITVVLQPNGDGHAVLTVRTDRGDVVLDNLNDRVLPWEQTDYTFLKLQSPRNSAQWELVDDARAIAVGAISR